MNETYSLLQGDTGQAIEMGRRQQIAGELRVATGLDIYSASVSRAGDKILALGREGAVKRLVAVAASDPTGGVPGPVVKQEQSQADGGSVEWSVVELTPDAIEGIRQNLPWTRPSVQGLDTSAGLGDRLGLATPGHLQAAEGTGVVPFVAQQSIREMTRTQRTATEVMHDATVGVFQTGWQAGYGSDADHLKTTEDIDNTLNVGFTMFTIDPGDHVRADADDMAGGQLTAAAKDVDWAELEVSDSDFARSYAGQTFKLESDYKIEMDEETALRAIVKYGGAIAHTKRMYRHLSSAAGDRPFELEVSVDETATPTTIAEHYIIASELRRLGVKWVSLAPRFVGEFEKGIDYKGDLSVFESDFAQHVAIARTLGPYKLSLHSGSDKFSVYPIAARLTDGLVHLKTAGTSYLEALRVAARKSPDLFRRILDFAFTRFDEDRASYHISARVEVIPRSEDLNDDQLEIVLNGNDGRQLLHVTFGSVLTTKNESGDYLFRNELLDCLRQNEEEHYSVVAHHLGRHIQPFAKSAR